jgi:hypothetical protein
MRQLAEVQKSEHLPLLLVPGRQNWMSCGLVRMRSGAPSRSWSCQ